MIKLQKQAPLDKCAIPAGCLSFALRFLLGQFSGSGWTDFLAGMFTGLSFVLNIYGLHRYSHARKVHPVEVASSSKDF